MSLAYLAFTLFLALARPAPPPAGRLAPVDFDSAALAGRRHYVAWLPPGYDPKGTATYPVVVLLHGLGGHGRDWFARDRGDLGPTLARLIAAGSVPPLVALAPDGDDGYWTDHLGAPTERYGAFVDEVVADAASRFRLALDHAAIAGVSMGGHGALSRAFIDPARWRAAVSLSGALFSEPPTHRPIYKKVWGFPADPAHWAATAPMELARHLAPERAPPLFIAVGRHDAKRFLPWNTDADHELAGLGIAHELVLTDGGHDWDDWRGLADRWLGWLASRLR